VRSGVVPSLLEFMDRTSVHAVNDSCRLGFGGEVGALVLAQSDASSVRAKEEIALLADLLADAGALDVVVAADQAEGALLLAARRQVLTAFESLGAALIDDVCVPRDRLAALVDGVEALATSAGLTVGLFGHAGDGNFHPTVVFDASVPEQVAAANRLFEDIMLLGLDLGGTITGEHGVGTLKRDLLVREVGEVSMRVHRGIKTALDPMGILNPGKVF
ncbi:MAG: FAD-binding oxidoreductase, partial [Nocardioidaceae bacterium]|nr:FAD-binding oxidoreductase [Nocardioidaceae bacterium]